MTRLDILPENYFTTVIKGMISNLESIKNRQNVGSDSLVLYVSYTAGHAPPAWDIPGIAVGAYAQKTITITFEPTGKKPVYAALNYQSEFSPFTTYETIEMYPDPAGQDLLDGKVQWVIIFTNDSVGTTLNLNVVVRSTDTGVITYGIA